MTYGRANVQADPYYRECSAFIKYWRSAGKYLVRRHKNTSKRRDKYKMEAPPKIW